MLHLLMTFCLSVFCGGLCHKHSSIRHVLGDPSRYGLLDPRFMFCGNHIEAHEPLLHTLFDHQYYA
jgi:hypothetical protein